MRTRREVILALVLAGCLPASAAPTWRHYVNDRFGTEVDYPAIFRAEPPPENNDGRMFHSQEADIRVFGRWNIDDETPQSLLDGLATDPAYADTTYRRLLDDRLVISGLRGAYIFYEVYLCSASGVVHTLMITYPARDKLLFDPIVTRMSRSFGGP